MMDLIVLLAIVFCGRAVCVGAVFYVEVKASTTTTDLYECKGHPTGRLAKDATESDCTPVYAFVKKTNIHATCNFYHVYRPELQGHTIHLQDRGVLRYQEWYVGFSYTIIDHPNFGEPRQSDLLFFSDKVMEMTPTIVEFNEVNSLTRYFARANVLAYLGDHSLAYRQLTTFATVLQRIINEYGVLSQTRDAATVEQLKNRVGGAMKVALRKMIDPCRFFQGFFERSASTHCDIYCNFLNTAVLYFGPPNTDRCTSIVGGSCQYRVCTCARMSSSIFRGCDSSPMRMCNNAMRVKLDL